MMKVVIIARRQLQTDPTRKGVAQLKTLCGDG